MGVWLGRRLGGLASRLAAGAKLPRGGDPSTFPSTKKMEPSFGAISTSCLSSLSASSYSSFESSTCAFWKRASGFFGSMEMALDSISSAWEMQGRYRGDLGEI